MKTKKIRSTVLALLVAMLLVEGSMISSYASSLYEYAGVLGTAASDGSTYTLGTPTAIAKDSSGYYYVADMANNRVLKLNSSMQKVGSIENIDMPLFVYVDNDGAILVNELGTHSIKKYSAAGSLLGQWGGKGTQEGKFNIPRSIVQDSAGNYYVSDELNHRIQKFTREGAFLAAYGTYGENAGQFKVQQGVSIDAQDRLYVADTYNNRIQVFQTHPTWQHLASFGMYGLYQPFNYYSFQPEIFNHPRGVYVEKSTGRVAVTDSLNNRIMVYNSYENGFTFYQSQNGYLGMSLPTHAILENNRVIAVDSHSRILKYSSSANNTFFFVEYGQYRRAEGVFSNPQSLCVDQITEHVFVSDSFNHRIQEFDKNGNFIRKYGGMGGPSGFGTGLNYFHYPKQTAVDAQGTLYVADFANARVVMKPSNSPWFSSVLGSYHLQFPWGVAVSTDGRVYVSDWGDDKIKVLQNGSLVNSWGSTGTGNGQFKKPADLKIGAYQGQQALYIADCGNNRIQIFSMEGVYLGTLGQTQADPLENYDAVYQQGGMLLPYSMAIAPNGNVVVADTSHKCMRVYDSQGVWLDTFGSMSNTPGNYFSPMGCDINLQTGRLYIADGVLQRVQYFDPAR